ncbi:MAG: C40 family peptidase [Gemmatimonadaceae bacterium]|nr:C40 family peptidase [Gemmatimonadaceae bacterium]
MPISLARAVRRLLPLIAMVAATLSAPTMLEAERASAGSVAASVSMAKPKPKPRVRARASRTARQARPSRAKAASRRGKASRASSGRRRVTSRRGRRAVVRNLGPVVPVVAQASFVSESADQLRDSIVSVARQQIGTPYVWGAEIPGRAFDCSGLVKYVMSWLNVSLPRTANEQAYTGISVGRDLDRMKPGDLLTFGTGRRITHIAIYSGNGRYVHASRPGVGVVESLLDPRARRFRGAVRLVADADTTTDKSAPIP